MGELNQTSIKSNWKNFFKMLWREYSVVVVFIGVFIACTIITQGKFASVNNIMAILRNISTIGMISLGMTFVLISGGIDLSSGPVLATAGAVLIILQGTPNVPLWVAILACCGVGVGFGFVNGIIITKTKLPPFIVTLAVGIMARSIVMFFTKGATITGKSVHEFTNIGNGNILGIPIPFLIVVIAAILLTILLTKTKFGTYVFAVGGNENAAKYSGIKTDKIKVLTYMLLGLCVAIAATIEMSRMAAVASTTSGNMYEFEAITAAIVGGASISGGRGKIVGTVVGFLILGIISNMMIMMNISPYLNGAVKGLVILLAVLFQRRERY
ncbi:MAG TPA: ABC transporter permease [Candidatus Humimicrobiaceae bacterium]|jgi:ribose transport system permease protein